MISAARSPITTQGAIVLPLVISSGSCSEMRQGVGVAVFFGMIVVPLFGLVFTPFFYMIVGTLIFPFILLIVPITIAWIRIGLFDTFLGLWLAFQIFAVPYSMWILRGYFAGLPKNLEEAAMVYGCTQFQAFYRVMLPLAKPAIATIARYWWSLNKKHD